MNLQSRLPWPLLVLDLFGAALLALGLLIHFGQGDFLPPRWQEPNLAFLLMVCGVMLMVPMVAHIVGLARQRQRPGR
jgi:multisubunit Na+/H+ antiporter MnhG subunit